MSAHVREILESRAALLISDSEARDALAQLAKNAQFNADYSDDPNSYKRWSRIAESARSELVKLRGAGRRKYDREIIGPDWDRGVSVGDFARGEY